MRQSGSTEWVHYICALTSDEFECSSFAKMDFLRVNEIKEKKSMKCDICTGKIKESSKCSETGCGTVSHIYCIMRERVETMLKEGIDEESDKTWTYYLALSQKNSRKEKILSDMSKFFSTTSDDT